MNINRDPARALFDKSLREECSISASLVSARLASSINCQSSLVRLPSKWTKVVTMGAPLNRYGFVISLLLSIVVLMFFSGYDRCWGGSKMSWQK